MSAVQNRGKQAGTPSGGILRQAQDERENAMPGAEAV